MNCLIDLILPYLSGASIKQIARCCRETVYLVSRFRFKHGRYYLSVAASRVISDRYPIVALLIKGEFENHEAAKFIRFVNAFSKPIQTLAICATLEHLVFGNDFDQSIEALATCTALTHLQFRHNFNQSIEALATCTALKRLEFGNYFNRFVRYLLVN